VPALALEFLILTASRSGEVRGAVWSEIDPEGTDPSRGAGGVWTIPSERMKAGISHRVPLSSRAIEILAHLAQARTGPLVFPGRHSGHPISNTGLELLAKPATVHGFRSSFRDWCGDQTSFPRELAEAALAHRTGDAVELAYRRSDALERRRQLMDAWATYCTSPDEGGNVIPIMMRK
jgi:integrase